jgi:C-terminal processing protease CtpA/Prc
MTHSICSRIALGVLMTAAFAMYAVAKDPSDAGSKNGQDKQAQGQDASGNDSSSAHEESSKDSQRSSSSKDNSNQDNADRNERSGSDRAASSEREEQNRSDRDRSSKQESSTQSDRRDRRDSDSSRSDQRDSQQRDDRSARSEGRNADNRSGRSDQDRLRDKSERSDRRGPDIGLWFNRSTRDGLVISDVDTKGPIAKFGFHEGDRIVSVHGHRVTSEADFIRFLLHSDVDRVKVIVIRDGHEETIIVDPAVFVEEREYADVDPLERFGIILDDRYDDRIVVWRVIPRSPAYYAGFRPGDVIITFGDHPYRSRTEFEKGVVGWKTGEVNVQVRRGDRTRDLSADVPRSDRMERRDYRVERRDANQTERGVERSARRDVDQQPQSQPQQDNRRGGILRGRGNR